MIISSHGAVWGWLLFCFLTLWINIHVLYSAACFFVWRSHRLISIICIAMCIVKIWLCTVSVHDYEMMMMMKERERERERVCVCVCPWHFWKHKPTQLVCVSVCKLLCQHNMCCFDFFVVLLSDFILLFHSALWCFVSTSHQYSHAVSICIDQRLSRAWHAGTCMYTCVWCVYVCVHVHICVTVKCKREI